MAAAAKVVAPSAAEVTSPVWFGCTYVFASVVPVYPKSANVNVLVDTVPLASVTWPLVSVVMLKSKSLITVAPVNGVVSILISSPGWVG